MGKIKNECKKYFSKTADVHCELWLKAQKTQVRAL